MTETTGKRTSRKERVSWTDSELQTMIDEAVLISLEDTEHVWCYLAKAQSQVLPVDRHRRIGGKHVVTLEILARFEKARKEFLGQMKQPAEAAEVPVPTSAPVPAAPVDRAALIESLTNVEVLDLIVRRLGPLFAGIQALAGGIGTHVRKSESEVKTPAPDKQAASPAFTPSAPPPPAKPSAPPTKTKVLLFGFDAASETEIMKKAANFELELFFVSQPLGQPVPPIPVCDWCIVKRPLDMSRRAKDALSRRPGVNRQINAGTVETVLQHLNNLNSRQKR